MPKFLYARPPCDEAEERTIRKLAGARHAPGDWIRRAKMIVLSWQGQHTPIAGALVSSPDGAGTTDPVRHRRPGRPGGSADPRASAAAG